MKSMLTRISQVLLFCSLLFAAGAAMGADDADKITIKWSATVEAVATDNEPPDNQDDVTGFFDQFYYTPNKEDFFLCSWASVRRVSMPSRRKRRHSSSFG